MTHYTEFLNFQPVDSVNSVDLVLISRIDYFDSLIILEQYSLSMALNTQTNFQVLRKINWNQTQWPHEYQ